MDLVARAGEWHPPDRFDEYRLIRPLGRGSFGKVYLAQDEVLDRPVAIKIVTHLRDDSIRARFLIEARYTSISTNGDRFSQSVRRGGSRFIFVPVNAGIIF